METTDLNENSSGPSEDRKGMPSESAINYESMMHDAMRGVVRRVLELTVDEGLPGDHHFYISFDTLAPGVILSKRLREKYAQEMTIVLQHRFWDLAVGENYFEVKLTFDGIPERLVVPFAAIKVFFDPSVRYGLQFEANDLEKDGHPQTMVVERGDIEASLPSPVGQHHSDVTVSGDPPAENIVIEPAMKEIVKTTDENPELIAKAEIKIAQIEKNSEPSDSSQDDSQQDKKIETNPKVVSLDAFRKK